MLAIERQYKSNIIPLSIPPEPRPGDRIQYTRNGRLLSGVLMGTVTTQVRRFKIDGKHPVIVEYIVVPDAEQTNLSYHTVHESDVIWSKVQ